VGTTVTCTCGRPLLLRPEHAGRPVRCPLCGRQFTAPGPDAVAPAALPAEGGATYDLVPEERPPTPPAVRDLLRRPGRGAAEETCRRRAPLLHRCLGGVWDFVDHRVVYRLVWLVLLMGGMFVFYGLREMWLAVGASETPQRLTLAQLAANGPGDNAHVVLTDFALCDGYVCLVKVGRFDRFIKGTDPRRERWEGVFIPAVPLTPELRQHRARGAAEGRPAAPGNIRVLLLSYAVHGEADLDQLENQPELRGTVINSIQSLDGKTVSLLREMYPGTDFGNCLIFQAGRRPSPTVISLLVVFLASLAIVAAGFLLLVRHLYTPRRP
jgi:hypothetical protein